MKKQLLLIFTALAVVLSFSSVATTAIAPQAPDYTVTTISKQSLEYADVRGVFADGLMAVQIGANKHTGKWGFVNRLGELVIPAEYGWVSDFSGGFAMVGTDDPNHNIRRLHDKYGVINTRGEIVVPIEYSEIKWFDTGFVDGYGSFGFFNGLLAVCVYGASMNDQKWGFVNTNGEVVVPLEYDFMDSFWDGMAWAQKGDKWTILNTKGELATQAEFPHPVLFSEGLGAARHCDSGKWGYVDTDGNVVIPFEYDYAFPFKNGFARVAVGPVFHERQSGFLPNIWGFIDTSGKLVIPHEYSIAEDFSEDGLAAVGVNGYRLSERGYTTYRDVEWGFVNTSGEVVHKFNEGLAAVRDEGFWGFINTKGEIVIEPQFSGVREFSNGLAAVAKPNSGWGFINQDGEVIVPFKYIRAESFKDGFGVVWERCDSTPLISIRNVVNTNGEIVSKEVWNFDGSRKLDTDVGNGLAISVRTEILHWIPNLPVSQMRTVNKSAVIDITDENRTLLTMRVYDRVVFAETVGNTSYFWVHIGALVDNLYSSYRYEFGDVWEIIAVTNNAVNDNCGDCNCRTLPNSGRRGHVRGEVNITVADALEILKYIVGLDGNLIVRCDNSRRAAAVTGNEFGITVADALKILKHVVGLVVLE